MRPFILDIFDINRLKIKLSLDRNDTDRDEILETMFQDSVSYVSMKLDVTKIPEDAVWIAEDLTVLKFNKLGNEGLSSFKVNVIENSFVDDIYRAVDPLIDKYINSRKINKLRIL